MIDDDLKYVYKFLFRWFCCIIILIVSIIIMMYFIFQESNLEILRSIDSKIYDLIVLIPIGILMLGMHLGLKENKEINYFNKV